MGLTAHELAEQRMRLVAAAQLQRVRLALDVHDLRRTLRPARWAAPALGVGAAALALMFARRSRRGDAPAAAAAHDAGSPWRAIALVAALAARWLRSR